MCRSSSTLRMSRTLARLVTQSTPSTCSSSAVSRRTRVQGGGGEHVPGLQPDHGQLRAAVLLADVAVELHGRVARPAGS